MHIALAYTAVVITKSKVNSPGSCLELHSFFA